MDAKLVPILLPTTIHIHVPIFITVVLPLAIDSLVHVYQMFYMFEENINVKHVSFNNLNYLQCILHYFVQYYGIIKIN